MLKLAIPELYEERFLIELSTDGTNWIVETALAVPLGFRFVRPHADRSIAEETAEEYDLEFRERS